MKNKIKHKAYIGFQTVVVGCLTGILVGLVVTCYNLLAHMAEEFSCGYYGFFREHPAFIPLLFLVLAVGAIVIGGVLKFLPMIRGSGIPQTEGATRGLIKFKWFRTLTGMFAASLFTIFLGLSAGSEGPSIMIGGSCGCGVSDALKRNAIVRRYQITGGACAGLAVAFNAPLTGMAFAFEEAHKRFTPEVFVCAFTSVVTAVLVRNLLYFAMGMEIGAAFGTYSFAYIDYSNFLFYAYVLFSALITAFLAIGFYFLIFLSKKLFKRITFFKGMGKFLIPFLAAGAFGLITVNVMGGGSEFLRSLGSQADGIERVFSSPLFVTLLVVVILKTLATLLNIGAGVPCGVFVPMLAIGAGLGALLSLLCQQMGMPPAYSDVLIFICMATFFTTVIRAPLTGIVMVLELTFSFTFLLPVILGVAVGYLVGDFCRVEPLYDKLLAEIVEAEHTESIVLTKKFRVLADSAASGRSIRDVLWPTGTRIILITKGEEDVVPDGNNVLAAGDIITVTGRTSDEKDFVESLAALIGETVEEAPLPADAPPAPNADE